MIILKRPAWSLLASAVATGVALAQQVPLAQQSNSHKGPVLNGAVRAKISALAQAFNVPGYSIAVYSEGAGQETFQWGNMTEKGDAVAADVRRAIYTVKSSVLTFLDRRSSDLLPHLKRSLPSHSAW
jgi:hypothetical protein